LSSKSSPGYFSINGIVLPIDPQGIALAGDGVIFTTSTLHKEDAAMIKTGRGDLTLNVNWLIAREGIETGHTLHQEINSKLVPLYRCLTTYPFCVIKSTQVESLLGDATTLWAWRNMTVSMGGRVPKSTIAVEMTFEIFDWSAFIPTLNFRSSIDLDNIKTAELLEKYALSKGSPVSFADGEDRFRDYTVGEIYSSEGTSGEVASLEDSGAWKNYQIRLEANAIYASDFTNNRDITLTPTSNAVITLPSNCWPPVSDIVSTSPFKTISGGGSTMAGTGTFPTDNATTEKIRAAIAKENNGGSKFPGFAGKLTDFLSSTYNTMKAQKEFKDKSFSITLTPSGGPWDPGTRGQDSRHRHGGAVDIHFPGIYTYKYRDANKDNPLDELGQRAYLTAAMVGEQKGLFWGGHFSGYTNSSDKFGNWGDFIHFELNSNKGHKQPVAEKYLQEFKKSIKVLSPSEATEIVSSKPKQEVEKPSSEDYYTNRLKAIVQLIGEGWNIVGLSTDGRSVFVDKKLDGTTFGSDGKTPIISGLSVTLTNRMASLQLQSKKYPVKQYSGGVTKRVVLNLTGPGGIADSNINKIVNLFENDLNEALISKSVRRRSGIGIQHNLINIFDIDKVNMVSYEVDKSHVAVTTANLVLQPTANDNKRIHLVGSSSSVYLAKKALLQKLLDNMKFTGSDPASILSAGHDQSINTHYKGISQNTVIRPPWPTKEIGDVDFGGDSSEPRYELEQRIQTDVLIAAKEAYSGKVIDKGMYSDQVIEKFGLKNFIDYVNPIMNPEVGEFSQAKIQKQLELTVKDLTEKLESAAKVPDTTLIDRYTRELTTVEEQLNKLKNTSKTKSVVGAVLNSLGSSYDTMGQTISQQFNGSLSRRLGQILESPNFAKLVQMHPDYQNVIKEFKDSEMAIATARPLYEHLYLPPDPLTNSPNGLNPDFFFAPVLWGLPGSDTPWKTELDVSTAELHKLITGGLEENFGKAEIDLDISAPEVVEKIRTLIKNTGDH